MGLLGQLWVWLWALLRFRLLLRFDSGTPAEGTAAARHVLLTGAGGRGVTGPHDGVQNMQYLLQPLLTAHLLRLHEPNKAHDRDQDLSVGQGRILPPQEGE